MRYGYWGWEIIAEGDHTRAAHPAMTTAFGPDVLAVRPRGSWQEISIHARHDDVDIAGVAAAIGAPVLAFYIFDGDWALGGAATPSGVRFDAVLTKGCALADLPTEPPVGYRHEDALAGAVAWAHETGLTADPAMIEHALRHDWLDMLYD